jgi:hypothetical protein
MYESPHERLLELESLNRELNADNQALVSKASARPVVFLCGMGSQSSQTGAIPGRAD